MREKFVEEQNEILEKARREMFKEDMQKFVQGCYVNPYISEESNIILSAQQMARQYLASDKEGTAIYADMLFLYRILLTPPELMTDKMYDLYVIPIRLAMPKDVLPSFYRKNAIRIHQDKNKHPQAIEAFQKFTECYKRCAGS